MEKVINYIKSRTYNIYFCMFVMLGLMITQKICAATTVSLYVGQSQIISAPNAPQGALYAVTWASRHASVSVSNYGSYGGQVSVNSYFQGTAEIQCDYYWRWYSGTTQHTNHATTYYYVTCKAVNLSINPSSMTLNLNEGVSISYSLSPNISPTPTVRFYSNNTNVATVNSNGYVYATGAGSTTITIENSAGPSASCSVQVKAPVVVTSASVSSPINIGVDEQKHLSVSTYPSDAPVDSRVWRIAEGDSYISLSSSGLLTGTAPGTAKIYCTVNGNVVSNTAIVNVTEPPLTCISTSPLNEEIDVSAFVKPSVTFSQVLYEGEYFSSITLKDEENANVDGTVSLHENLLSFSPSRPLSENTFYTLNIPVGAVKNKWGSSCETDIMIRFKTGEYTKLTLTASPPSGYIFKDSCVMLTASHPNSHIYYTSDGSIPTTSSSLYKKPIVVDRDMQLRAVAVGAGYRQSDVLVADYILSSMEIDKRFPLTKEPMFIYKDVVPFIKFRNRINASSNIDNVMLTKDGMTIRVETIVNDSTLFIVPEEPLSLGCTYTVTIPAEAVASWQGEGCKATSWTFSTGDFATAISVGGPELGTAIKTDGSLWTWGQLITGANAEDGSYSYTQQIEPADFVSGDVVAVSSGYMHHALIKRDGSLWMWGRQYCGEFGNGSTTASALPVKVMDGVKRVSCGLQNTAIVKQDGTLWMCGRNDLGQIDESCTVLPQYVMVAEDVSDITLNWGSLQIVRTDGTIDIRTWDEEFDAQRKPVEPDNLDAEFETIEYGWKNAVALEKNGCVWAWGDSSQKGTWEVTPSIVIAGRNSSELKGVSYVNSSITLKEGEKSVAEVLPVPLTADYASLSWMSSDEGVAKVTERGVVTGITPGEAKITVTITSTQGVVFTAICNVTVTGMNVDAISHSIADDSSDDNHSEDPVYNLQGQQVKQPRKGIFIRRGKKDLSP